MDLVIDANVVISALISSEGKTSELIFSNMLNLFAPDMLFDELGEHKKEILLKSGLSADDFVSAFSLLRSRIGVVPVLEFKQYLLQAKIVCPDEGDIEYFAVAIRLGCPIWSEDKALKKQDVVKVLNTSELLKLVSFI